MRRLLPCRKCREGHRSPGAISSRRLRLATRSRVAREACRRCSSIRAAFTRRASLRRSASPTPPASSWDSVKTLWRAPRVSAAAWQPGSSNAGSMGRRRNFFIQAGPLRAGLPLRTWPRPGSPVLHAYSRDALDSSPPICRIRPRRRISSVSSAGLARTGRAVTRHSSQPRGPRAASICRRVAPDAAGTRDHPIGRHPHRVSGRGVQCRDRLRARRREAGASDGRALPGEPAAHARRSPVFWRAGRTAYEDRRRNNPEVRALARRVDYYVDPDFPGPGRFKGAVRVTLQDGRVLSDTQEHNRGSVENPLSDAELRAKFDDNAAALLSATARDRLADAIAGDRAADGRECVGCALRTWK